MASERAFKAALSLKSHVVKDPRACSVSSLGAFLPIPSTYQPRRKASAAIANPIQELTPVMIIRLCLDIKR